jgi:hypothetical protein
MRCRCEVRALVLYLFGRALSLGVDFFEKIVKRVADAVVVILPGTALTGDHRTPVERVEVAVGKQIPALCALGFVRVFAEMPLRELREAVVVDERVFVVGGRRVFTPVVSLVERDLVAAEETFGVSERFFIESDGHWVSHPVERCGVRSAVRGDRTGYYLAFIFQLVDPSGQSARPVYSRTGRYEVRKRTSSRRSHVRI